MPGKNLVKMLFAMLALTLAFAVHAAPAQDPGLKIIIEPNVKVERFYGYAYDLDTNKYLYTEVHVQRYQGDHWLGGTQTYYAPNGTEIGQKVLDFSEDPYIPLYRLDLKNIHYSEGINKITADRVYMFRQDSGEASPQRGSVKRKKNMAADSGFDTLIKAHFALLLRGKSFEFPLVVAGKLSDYNFTVSRLKDGTFEGKKAVRFKVGLSSMLHYIIGKPLILTYDPQTKKLLEYRGISDLYNPKTHEPYHVRIDYYSSPPADAPRHLPPLNPDGKTQ